MWAAWPGSLRCAALLKSLGSKPLQRVFGRRDSHAAKAPSSLRGHASLESSEGCLGFVLIVRVLPVFIVLCRALALIRLSSCCQVNPDLLLTLLLDE